MQKLFRKYTVAIMTTAIFLILVINIIFTSLSLCLHQHRTFQMKIDQIIRSIEENESQLSVANQNLNVEYLTRAKTAAYVIQKDPSVLENPDELQMLADSLSVDEVSIINPKGILLYSSVSDYIGIDIHDYSQMQSFFSVLDSDKNAYLILPEQKYDYNGKFMKYIGVARQDKKGVVLVGLSSTRLKQARGTNTYDSIFSSLTLDTGEIFLALDKNSGTLLGHSDEITEKDFHHCITIEMLEELGNDWFLSTSQHGLLYITTEEYEDIIICATLPVSELIRSLMANIVIIFICLVLIEFLVLMHLNYLLKKNVLEGIHKILAALTHISLGNLDTLVDVGGNPEFEQLSAGINNMVSSISHTSDRITKIINLSQIPLAAFEYEKETNHLFFTSGIKKLLHFTDKEISLFLSDPTLFYQHIQQVMKNKAEDETDIFVIDSEHFVRIHLSTEATGYLGVVTDATTDIQKKRKMLYDNTHDQLTGLYRYKNFKESMQKHITNLLPGKLCACVMLDLDYFKEVNDTYGHDIGDIYLKHFAHVLMMLPKDNCIVARRSGDEFCFFTYGHSSVQSVRAYVENFWTLLQENPLDLPDTKGKIIGASGGFAWTGHSDIDINDLLNRADQALYETKEHKKGTLTEWVKNPN